MTTRRRTRVAIICASILVAAVASLCVAYTPARSFELRDTAGAPIGEAYIAYHHDSSVFNFVDSLSRDYPGRLIRPDVGGRVRIPARLALKGPLDSRPVVRVSFVYAPALHNALAGGLDGSPIPGVVDIDPQHTVMTMHDVSVDPARWERSLDRLLSAVRYEFWPADTAPQGRITRRVHVTHADLEPLVQAIAHEYRALHERFAKEPRKPPSQESMQYLQAPERAEYMARAAKDLARDPQWGSHLERRWPRAIEQLQRAWAQLE